MANVLYGHKNTHKINLENIIQHSISAKRGIKKSLLVVDMPKGTYSNVKSAIKNAKMIIKKTRCDAVKLENNKKFKIIENLVKRKIAVMGHIGFTPQFKKFKIEGNAKRSFSFVKRGKINRKSWSIFSCARMLIS